MDEDWLRRFGTLLEGPSPAVLTTYRQDGTALTSPVWFRFHDVAPAPAAIAGRYLGVQAGLAFARQRDKRGVRVRLDASAARVWDLSAILPAQPV